MDTTTVTMRVPSWEDEISPVPLTAEYEAAMQELTNDPRIREMLDYRQHGSSTTYAHSVDVAVKAYRLSRRLHIRISERELARGAMLHDFYLYDIKGSGISKWRHGTGHAKRALENARQHYDLSPREEDIIYSHMWPLNLTHLPHYRESVLVSTADKYCAVRERLSHIAGYFRAKERTSA